MNNKLLSIGSVVLLKDADKRVMIIGYYPTVEENGNEVTYDYSACLFPEGVMNSKSAMLFNHSEIDKLFYYGLMDGEQNEFMTKLEEFVAEENKNNLISNNSNTNESNMNNQSTPSPIAPVIPIVSDSSMN